MAKRVKPPAAARKVKTEPPSKLRAKPKPKPPAKQAGKQTAKQTGTLNKAAARSAAVKTASKAGGKAAAVSARALESSDSIDARVLDRLAATVLSRRAADPTVSHSARLISRGTAKVAQKFGEEAVECLIEAVLGDNDALVAESADVLYHLIVMWVNAGVAPGAVWQELQRREGMSGIDEKARRKIVPATTKIP